MGAGKLKEERTAKRREQSGYSPWSFAGFIADFRLLFMRWGKAAQENEL